MARLAMRVIGAYLALACWATPSSGREQRDATAEKTAGASARSELVPLGCSLRASPSLKRVASSASTASSPVGDECRVVRLPTPTLAFVPTSRIGPTQRGRSSSMLSTHLTDVLTQISAIPKHVVHPVLLGGSGCRSHPNPGRSEPSDRRQVGGLASAEIGPTWQDRFTWSSRSKP